MVGCIQNVDYIIDKLLAVEQTANILEMPKLYYSVLF
jgi:hypothetical protein